ncbi:hypothetical protein PM21P2_00048 [Parabacteroides phage PM21P2]|nr:hypothetical protein PM21P1_00024 [Parabacteroides phage PM21P1]WAX17320.1 hypothetical protein PM21P2_00048 [Parabacteroides phage PM21P2]
MKREELVVCFTKGGEKWLGYLMDTPGVLRVVLRGAIRDYDKAVIDVKVISDPAMCCKAYKEEIAYYEAVVREFDGNNFRSFAL